MNWLWVYAYVVMPVAIVALGYAEVRWDERKDHDSADKHHGSAE
jgi:hypothetical protein